MVLCIVSIIYIVLRRRLNYILPSIIEYVSFLCTACYNFMLHSLLFHLLSFLVFFFYTMFIVFLFVYVRFHSMLVNMSYIYIYILRFILYSIVS